MTRLFAALILSMLLSFSLARAAERLAAQTDQETAAILAKIPVEKRVELLAGIDNFSTRGYPNAGLPQYLMSDGPLGIRAERREYASAERPKPVDRSTTAFPASILLAATWDPSLARDAGIALAREARDYGIHILLGPGVNIYRLPICGRNFEYLGEDPYLTSRMVVANIEGIQSQGVAACVKHFACNNLERDRTEYDAIVDERALHEIYLPAFEAAVREAHVRTIMSSYNKLNGTYTASNRKLLVDLLRTDWGFDGVCMSDWDSIHETLATINDGVDLEMPEPKYFAAENICALLAERKKTQSIIDAKLRRIIRLGVEMGWNDRPQRRALSAADVEQNEQVGLKVARAGITLLKNEHNVLPLDRTKIKAIAVVGPGAAEYVSGDGSSRVQARRPQTILDGIRQLAGDHVRVISVPTATIDVERLAKTSNYESANGRPPLQAEYFANSDLKGMPIATLLQDSIAFGWQERMPIPRIADEHFSVRWTGVIHVPIDASYTFAAQSDDGSRVFLNDRLILDHWQSGKSHVERVRVNLKAGESHRLRVEYFNSAADAEMYFGWALSANAISDEQLAAIKTADAVICCVRTLDSEGDDRAYDLPLDQEQLINECTAANPKTIVVLNSGGNVGMCRWIDRVPALLDAYFSGQAGGVATAEILFGDVNPSGHLPATFEKSWDDAFARQSYEQGRDSKEIRYSEGVFVGYRYFDHAKVEPRFPFGHGLSYTTFTIGDPRAEPLGENAFTVTARVTNTGDRAGAAVAQLYVCPPTNDSRPIQELKSFTRVQLAVAESKTITFQLNARSFSIWDVQQHRWRVPPGKYVLAIGQSSRAIDATTQVSVVEQR